MSPAWDDPRMPTLCGLRRRGYTAAAIRNFCEMIGVGKTPSVIEYGTLEHCLREDLNATAERTMAVLHPVKLTVTNYPRGQERGVLRGEQPHRSHPGHPRYHLLPPSVDRGGRLYGDSRAQVQAP